MKLKFANSLLVAALVVTAAGCFSSCKDTDEDFYNNTEDQVLTLKQQLNNDVSTLETALSDLQNKLTTLQSQVDASQSCGCTGGSSCECTGGSSCGCTGGSSCGCGSLAQYALQTEVDSLKSLITQLQQANKANEDSIKSLFTASQSYKAFLGEYLDGDETLSSVLETLKDAILSQEQKDLAELKADLLKALQDTASDIRADIAEKYDEVKNLISEVDAQVAQNISDINDLQTAVAEIESTVTELQGDVETLKSQVADILNLFKTRITSLVVSQVTNPVIGSISLPIDVQSMILFNYYGLSNHEVKFPNFAPGADEEYAFGQSTDSNGRYVSKAVVDLLGGVQETVANAGETFLGNDGAMGSVYFTANPASIDLTSGYNFSLVKSNGEAAPIELSTPQPANHVITFGNSRADETPLWRADATLKGAGNVPAVKIELEDGLGSAVKDLVKNRSINSALSVAAKVYQTITNNSSLPAYGLKANWTDELGDESCYAQYNMAATSFRPLSFALLDGTSLSKYVPTIPSFDDLVGDITFDFGDTNLTLTFEGVEIDYLSLSDIEINVDFNDISATITIPSIEFHYEVPEYEMINGEVVQTGSHMEVGYTVPTQVDVESIAELKDKLEEAMGTIADAINASIEGWNDNLNDLIDNISSQLNDMLDLINEQVNTALSDILNDLQNEVNGKIDSILDTISGYYSKFESLTNKVVSLLDDPNHYLQVFMMYKSGDSFGRLSTSRVVPSIWTGNGTSATLIPTTYNAEMIAPAYKKYVAITNVMKADDYSVSAANGDATMQSYLKAANKGTRMNEVIDGEYSTVAFNFTRGEDLVYEIFYQAVDYRGCYSTRKYYVNVK